MAIDKNTIARPFGFGANGIRIATGADARAAKIQGILSIQATTPGYGMGELAWDVRRGSRLDALRNSSMTSAFEDIVIRSVEDTFAYGLPEEKLDAVGGEITDETIIVNVETVPAKERGNSQRTVAKSKFTFRRTV